MNSFKQEKKNFQCLWEVIGLGQFARIFFPFSTNIWLRKGILVTKILTAAFQKVKSSPVPIISY